MVREAWWAACAALLGLLLALRLADGSANALVQAWYEPVLVVSALILLGLAAVAAARALRSGERWQPALRPMPVLTGALVVLPVALGLVLKPEPLGSESLERTTGSGANRQFSLTAVSAEPAQRNLYQWAYEFEHSDPATILGEPVDIVAFVYQGKEEGPPDRFFAARFVVACCVADATGFTLPVQWPGAAELRDDQWVRIQGRVATGADGTLVIQATSVEPIDAPANPYIYP